MNAELGSGATSALSEPEPARLSVVSQHALGWLVAANGVGVLLATLLLFPAAGDWLGALTYGRWMAVHTNWQLYGWCSLPLIEVLHAWWGKPPERCAHAEHTWLQVSTWTWSAALFLGGLSWLAGMNSGKLFLEWHGAVRWALPTAMAVLWATLLWRLRQVEGLPGLSRTARWLMLALLLPIPAVIAWAAGRDSFPPVNPDSGGATGSSLLGSTLGIVAIFGLLPHLLSRPRRRFAAGIGRACWLVFAVSVAVFAFTRNGHSSHREVSQLAALATLGIWVPLGWLYFSRFNWSRLAATWLRAAGVWWAALVVSGWVTFAPGFSERLKFTHGLVAHAHLAMAAFVTSMLMAVIVQLGNEPAGQPLHGRGSFWLWQGCTFAHVAALLVLGFLETGNGALFRSEAWTSAFLAVRLAAGAGMFAAALGWFLGLRRQRQRQAGQTGLDGPGMLVNLGIS